MTYCLGITSTRLDDYPVWKILFEDVIMLVATWANLLLWRGGWDLCVKYVIPDPLIGGWICHWLGTIGLMSLQVRQVIPHSLCYKKVCIVMCYDNVETDTDSM